MKPCIVSNAQLKPSSNKTVVTIETSTNFQSYCGDQTNAVGAPSIQQLVSMNCLTLPIDLSRIPVNKGTNSRLGWTKYSDLYEIVYPSLVLISLCLLTGA